MRKKVDSRVRILVENAVAQRHRAFFVMVGDRGKDQVINLHYMLSKITLKKPSVLWCYKNDLGFSSHRKKRMKQLKSKIQKGLWDPNVDDPFELFVSSTRIRYCYYKETHSILGQTFGMCILQDFEAITPNVLCRAIETVEGGGIVCLLLKSMTSLRQLYNLTMDVHSRLSNKTILDADGKLESSLNVEPRFNERFILSLAECHGCLVVDDELNILPLSCQSKNITPCSIPDRSEAQTKLLKKSADLSFSLSGIPVSPELKQLKDSMKGGAMAPLIDLTVTVDQVKVLLSFIDSIAEKSLNSTISLTAGRGRGKSATLGLSIAAAIAYSYSNIFVTAPSPENVGTLFEFVQKGLVALGFKEHADFELVQGEVIGQNYSSETPDQQTSNRQLVRINVFRDHRQTIQYISPSDITFAKQSEILIIDEAAAIPLSLVTKLFGPYFVFLSSTVNGYEGTGRSLSVKLIQEIKKGSSPLSLKSQTSLSGRSLKELTLEIPIRYASEDPIEAWLNTLLCLNATTPAPLSGQTIALPSQCSLYKVNRDSLFSFHQASETFLHRMMSLFVSSHYKNSPNDLLLLSDAPAHHLFVLLPPVSDEQTELPDIYAAIQIVVEGAISKEAIRNTLSKGMRPSGDLLPWTLSQNFVDESFGSLNGARIVRVAVHPAVQRMGYGSDAIRQLIGFFEGLGSVDLLNESVPDITTSLKQEVEISDDEVVAGVKLENQVAKEVDSDNESTTDSNAEDIVEHMPNAAAAEESQGQSPKDATSGTSSTCPKKSNENMLLTEVLCVRDVPSLLTPCKDIKDRISIDYIGTSFGLTLDLFKFHSRLGFQAVYLRQGISDVTGEHSVIMLRPINTSNSLVHKNWLEGFCHDFRNRLVNLIGSSFQHLSINLCLSLLTPHPHETEEVVDTEPVDQTKNHHLPPLTHDTMYQFLSSHDILRLERYTQQLVERSLIADLIPTLSWLLFTERMMVDLSHLQRAVIMAIGSQRKSVDDIASEFSIPRNQVLALFNKAINRIYLSIHGLLERQVQQGTNERQMTVLQLPTGNLPEKSFDEELEEGAKLITEDLEIRKRNTMNVLARHEGAQKYSLHSIDDTEFLNAMKDKKTLDKVSIKSKRTPEKSQDQGFHSKQKKKKQKR